VADIKIDFLSWDSNFFNVKVGKADLSLVRNLNILNKVIKSISKVDYDLIYIFTDIDKMPLIKLENAAVEFVDTQIYLKMNIPSEIKLLEYELIKEGNMPKNVEIYDLYKISDGLASFSRFYNDKNISNEKVVELYRNFINNSLNGSYGEGLILDYNTKGDIIGLLSLDTICDIGKEILIGVKGSCRRKGYGEMLFYKSLSYWKDKGVQEVRTTVSARNINSLNFHLKLGFKVHKFSNVYHMWIKNQ